MLKSSAQKKYKKKIKLYKEYSKKYFEDSSPLVSDHDFDLLKKEILDLEKKFNFSDQDSPSKTLGFTPSKNFEKHPHRVKMLSLANAFDEKDLINFEKKMINFLNLTKNFEFEYSAEPKIDGISASLTYKKGKFVRGLSRGNGEEGEDITLNLKTISDIPHFIDQEDFPNDIDIRGEVFIQKNDFEKMKDNFANPRNAASRSLRQKDPTKTSKIPLKFVAYTFGFSSVQIIDTQTNFLSKLKSSKRKAIKKERKSIQNCNLIIQKLTGDELNVEIWDSFYKFYLNTIDKKWGGAYLTKDFFYLINKTMKNNILLITAKQNNKIVAGALNFIGESTLYGRNWGTIVNIPFLHFELCYYQAIEYAIEKNIKIIEAGAQGHHKIQRGYVAKSTYSSHYIQNNSFAKAVRNFVNLEAREIGKQIEIINQQGSPYSNN